MYPTRASQPSCIVLPEDNGHYELKSSTIPMLPIFRGVENENPYHHVREFEEICGTLRFTQMSDETLKLRLFPFSLKDKANAWLYALQPQSIMTWDDLIKEFFKKFFPNHKTATIRQSLNSFVQLEGETLARYLERFNELLLQCPHHGFEKWRLVQILYEGLDVSTRTTVESMCNGLFVDKTADASWDFLIEVAEKTQQWESIRETRKTTSEAKAFRIEADFEGRANMASIVRRLVSVLWESIFSLDLNV